MFIALYITFIVFVALEDIRYRKQKKLTSTTEEGLIPKDQVTVNQTDEEDEDTIP